MKWKHYFTNAIIDRGMKYYEKGRVDKLKKIDDKYYAEYEDKQFLYQIIDEAQYIKNHTTAAAKAVKCIQSKTKYALTGTPIENRLSELWSIFDYLMPGWRSGWYILLQLHILTKKRRKEII